MSDNMSNDFSSKYSFTNENNASSTIDNNTKNAEGMNSAGIIENTSKDLDKSTDSILETQLNMESMYSREDGTVKYYDSISEGKSVTKQPQTKRWIAISLLAAMSIAALCGAGVGVSKLMNGKETSFNAAVSGSKASSYKIQSTSVTKNEINTKADVSNIAQKVIPSVVAITETSVVTNYFFGGTYNNEVSGSGSGIIIGENNSEYLIATNNHVVDGAEKITITFVDKTTAKASVKGNEAGEDLAIVSVKKSELKDATKKAIAIATVGNSDSVRVGDRAIAVGNALGYGISVTSGYVSAKNRDIEIENNKMTVIQTDAAINPGNSGGALVNEKGEVIGINSAKLASQEVEGMGYAIPISKANPIFDDLMSKETLTDTDKGYLGISGRDISESDSEALGYPAGIYVVSVIDKGAAKAGGIIEGDIITKFDGKDVSSIKALASKVSSYKKGSKVEVTVMRAENGVFKEKKITVSLTGVIEDDKDKEDKTKSNNQGFN